VRASPARRFARRFARGAARVPILRPVVSSAYERYFNGAGGRVRLFNGIYPDFAAAARAIPSGRRAGHDNAASARRILDEWLHVSPSDYPTLFWLSRVLPDSRLLFDWGGNVGLQYFAFQRYLSYPPELIWRVNDVPAVTALGEEIARRESASALRFTTSLEELAEADVLLASGVLQFIEKPFDELRGLRALPRDVIVAKLPVYDRADAVTLHNMGTAFCPYRLFNRDDFLAEFARLGYRLVDAWITPGHGCRIPLAPEHSIQAYSGFYFTQRSVS